MPDAHPLISVIMPAYNAQATIGASVTGVLTQSYPSVELIVVDDGSTDRTREICEGYGGLVRYVHQDNGGSASARNHGFALAEGEFVALCDADDVFAPSYLEEMMRTYREAGGGRRIVMSEALIATSTGVSHGRRLNGGRVPPAGKQRMGILQKNFVPYMTLFPVDLVRELDGFAPEVTYNEDWDFFVRAIFAGWEVVRQPQPLVEYRWTPGAKSTKAAAGTSARRQILERVLRLQQLTPEERDYVERTKDDLGPRQLEAAASSAIRDGRWDEARRSYRTLLSVDREDPRVAVKAAVLSTVPGAMRLWQRRLRRLDAAMGRRKEERSR